MDYYSIWIIQKKIILKSAGQTDKIKMKFSIKNKLSRFSIFIIILSLLIVILTDRPFKRSVEVLYWDVISYYAYLPATFIHHDLTLNFIDQHPEKYENSFWPEKLPDGTKYIKTTMGMSFLYLPFFFIGHISAHLFNEETSGYSLPYRQALVFGALLYLGVALLFLKKLLRRFFSDRITALVLILIAGGTNLCWYSIFECTMPHLYNFMLITMFVWFTIKWHEKQSLRLSVILGLIYGLISLIRPTNMLVIVVFIFWNVDSIKSFVQKITFLLNRWTWILLIVISAFLVWVPQLIYWKVITGHWFLYTYGEERFFFNNPQIIPGLFSYRKGWLLYTPLMIFAIAGIPFLMKKWRESFFPVFLYLILSIYVIFSWWTWWYGGSSGCRPIIDSYGILAIPLGAFLTWLSEQKKLLKIILFTLVVLSSLMNIKYIINRRTGTLHHDSMSKKAYWDAFFKFRAYDKFYKLLEPPDYEKAMKGHYKNDKK